MAFKRKILVVANQTLDSDDLLDALRARSEEAPVAFKLVVPATPTVGGGIAGAQANLDEAVGRMREAGLEVEGTVGDGDPVIAVQEIWDPREFDEVIVSTFSGATSKWIRMDLPQRVARMTGVPVTHVVALPHEELKAEHAPDRERQGVLRPLSVLTWGGRQQRRAAGDA
jgi:GABA permease